MDQELYDTLSGTHAPSSGATDGLEDIPSSTHTVMVVPKKHLDVLANGTWELVDWIGAAWQDLPY